MEIKDFTFNAVFNQKLICEGGALLKLPEILNEMGQNILLITTNSFVSSQYYRELNQALKVGGFKISEVVNSGEPSTDFVDYVTAKYANEGINVVVSIGGGSAIDLGKAVSAMLPLKKSVVDYLEGIGHSKHPGIKVPFIAVPTTAGTGSEATKNAVISKIGENGYKKSLRHNNFMPDVAILDPNLIISCPVEVRIASGLDALSQLIESYVATNSNFLTEALCEKAFTLVGQSFEKYVLNKNPDIVDYHSMCLIAYCSGLALSNSGLGTVHGFASVIGGFYPIPHGVVCGKLLYEVTKRNIEKLKEKSPDSVALWKYSKIGSLITNSEPSFEKGLEKLLGFLLYFRKSSRFPSFSEYGIKRENFKKIVSLTSNKNNPILLTQEELINILENCYD